jgi:O-antigen ligase
MDTASGALLLFMTVWAPWAFGCTTRWAIQVMDIAGYTLGILLLAKWIVRWRADYTPARWAEPTPAGRWFVRLLAFLTGVIMAYVLAGAWNARAITQYSRAGVEFVYSERPPIAWLPTSYDALQSWPAFWNWLGIALAFWAARDWLLGKSRRERRQEGDSAAVFPSERLKVWLWTLVINSSLLALECILQRLDGTDKLLWLIKPAMGSGPDFRFGPYAYRTNAAQYFNLVWPLSLGFWWALRVAYRQQHGLRARLGGGAHVLLLPCTLLLAACPLIATSRGGALIMGGLTVGAAIILLKASDGSWRGRLMVGAMFVAVIGLGLVLGGPALSARFAKNGLDGNGRLEIYEAAYRMLPDFTWFGSGAGTFPSLFPIYRVHPDDAWASYVHNDWLEIRITLGRIGLGVLIAMLALVPLMGLCNRRPGGVPGAFAALLTLSLAGMLAHAVFDFPFRVHSLLFLFCLILAGASGLGRRPAT